MPTDPVQPADVEAKFDWRAQGLLASQREIIDELRYYRGASNYQVMWLSNPDLPSFTVRINGIECFKVGANGTISLPCSRWPVSLDRKTQVLEALAQTLGNDWFRGRETKKKGGDVMYVLRRAASVAPLVTELSRLGSAT